MAKKANREGSVYETIRNGKKHYTAQITVGYDSEGKQIRKSFSGYKKNAVLKNMRAAQVEIDRNLYNIDKTSSFSDFFYTWMYQHKLGKVNNTSFARYDSIYRNHIKDSLLSTVKLEDLNTLKLQTFFNKKIDSSEISETGARTILRYIGSCIRYAIENKFIYHNPCNSITLPKKVKEEKENVYMLDEQQKILDALTADTKDSAIKLAFGSGLRLGELLALKWEDFKENSLSINKQFRHEYKFDRDGNRTNEKGLFPLKTQASYRTVPLSLTLCRLLRKHKAEQNKWKMKHRDVYADQDFIFADQLGCSLERKLLPRRVKAICKQVGVEYKTFHSIRPPRLRPYTFHRHAVASLVSKKNLATNLNAQCLTKTFKLYV